ncbi:hydroxyphenylacetyl-CoA thioesterase PaaI [Amaricoccus solimangrovi]|uniref:Hydroxyphenylacetyl-CoA thioesterase PaaI n=1 Tax=Amaricoccus solimangrovi TaxID=2589815 RepID=A0A501WWU7_9RHOB|nr:hydroxyphenylacetyl-CoA thioesterase PaaI [Amaricoccus solimangrovi]TPE51907.1 hydroxyphenylacetyl-CoA thioesterase PaaI [Amaricoccus solimangrovi]
MSTATKLSPQALAEACADAMWTGDFAAQRLGMVRDHVAPGEAVLSMTITEAMLNGHDLAHGGYVFTLADTAFAYACNGYNQRTVGHQASITYVAPGHLGDRLTATAREIHRAGRGGIYDITVTNQRGERIAEFRGHSRTVKGTHLPE